ncbi:hypothetical protein G6M26_06110 [Agrobacterium tumefaciens]|nr:hypothetical protein [Agrobacterium tumefaciens]NTE18090.1 hypothetical protein [Agrobacterium tumefaciens]
MNSKEYQLYKNIDFANRYAVLSNSFQFEDRLDYSNDKVLSLIAKLGYKAKYIKNNNFFKIEEKINGYKFYLNICLKYSNTELIIGATEIEKDQFITGSVFGGLYNDIKYAEGIDLEENIRDPKFRNYEDLQIILENAFGIYEDFKRELIKQG